MTTGDVQNPVQAMTDATLLAHLQDEMDGATLYKTLADLEKNEQLAEIYRRLAAVEEKHATLWRERLAANGTPIPPYTHHPGATLWRRHDFAECCHP